MWALKPGSLILESKCLLPNHLSFKCLPICDIIERYLFFAPVTNRRTCKSLVISWEIGLIGASCLSFKWGDSWLGSPKITSGWELATSLNEQTGTFTPPPTSMKGRGAGQWINNWLCLHLRDETSIKLPKHWGAESFWLVNTCPCWAVALYRDRSSYTVDPFGPHPTHLFIWLFTCIPYDKPSNGKESVFLNSVIVLADYQTLQEGVCGNTQLCSQVGQKWITRGPDTCDWHLKGDWASKPVESDANSR